MARHCSIILCASVALLVGLGLVMLFIPLTAAKVAGLPHGNSAFWPRLFGIALIGVRLVVHLITLPVEWDASFNKALPILEQGQYLHPDDLPAARQVLKAAALTYVSVALASLLDLARWIRILR